MGEVGRRTDKRFGEKFEFWNKDGTVKLCDTSGINNYSLKGICVPVDLGLLEAELKAKFKEKLEDGTELRLKWIHQGLSGVEETIVSPVRVRWTDNKNSSIGIQFEEDLPDEFEEKVRAWFGGEHASEETRPAQRELGRDDLDGYQKWPPERQRQKWNTIGICVNGFGVGMGLIGLLLAGRSPLGGLILIGIMILSIFAYVGIRAYIGPWYRKSSE